jgi:hypothetical protein
VFLSAQARRGARAKAAENPGLVGALLPGLLEGQTRVRPERIRPLDARILEQIGALVDGACLE